MTMRYMSAPNILLLPKYTDEGRDLRHIGDYHRTTLEIKDSLLKISYWDEYCETIHYFERWRSVLQHTSTVIFKYTEISKAARFHSSAIVRERIEKRI